MPRLAFKKKVGFHISVKPVSIEFECPYCGKEITISWRDITPPEYWGDNWDAVECPECCETVELGEYDYD